MHPFGTDGLGRDVLSGVMYGARISLTLAFASVSLALLLGTLYGATAGMLGGVVDRVLMRFLDVALSIPRLLLLLSVTALWTSLELGALIVLLGATGWFDIARLVRGEVQSLGQREFVLAARATGVGRLRLLSRHLLPHLIPLLIVSASLNIAGAASNPELGQDPARRCRPARRALVVDALSRPCPHRSRSCLPHFG
jgi:peptide/nickel transport system permease protein